MNKIVKRILFMASVLSITFGIKFWRALANKSKSRSIIGLDERIRVINTQEEPYNSTVFIAADGSSGSGAVIGKNTVLTAAHVVMRIYGNPNKDSIYVIPGRDSAVLPYGKFKIKSVYIPKNYIENPNVDMDIAILTIDTLEGKSIGDVVPELPFKLTNTVNEGTKLSTVGYPGDKPWGTMWSSAGVALKHTDTRVYYDMDTVGGQSGSPVFNGINEIIAVHTTGIGISNFGTKLNTEFYQFILDHIDIKQYKKQNIFSIEEPIWISNSGMNKGQYHDRQDLGFILEKNIVLKIRQSNLEYKKNLTLWLLGNDSKVEKSISVGSEWKTISSTEATIPFVTTPLNTSGAELEYVVESNQAQKHLPIYSLNENEQAFFNSWDTQDAEYALIKGQDFQLLLPKRDKILARNLKDFESLNELIEYYRDLFEMYNKLAGFDGSSLTNKNGSNRYFLKADTHGAGGAYYSNNWTANSESTADMWLNKVSWGTLHEIGHGYQAGFDNKGMYTGEVSNNLYAVQYQYEKYGKEADKIGWLFDFGKKETVEKNLYTKMMNNSATYHSLDLREQLILLTMLKQKAGNIAFTKMNQGYREAANIDGFDKEKYQLPDLLNRYYSENSQLDFTPVLRKWALSLDTEQSEINQAKGYPAIASLADVVPESQLTKARSLVDFKLLITSNFEMVENTEISALNFCGIVTLKLKEENSKELIGTKVKIKEGNKVIQEKEITGTTVALNSLPNGVYTVEFTGKAMKNYVVETPYIYVKEGKNEVEMVLEKLNVSCLSNQKINFLGLGSFKFGEFKTNLNSKIATLSITSKTPHYYYKDGEVYATLKVKDAQNKTKYEKVVYGTDMELSSDIVSLDVGDQIDIYHAETKERLTSNEKIIDANKNTNSLIVTKNGLENQSILNDPEQDLIQKINVSANLILQNDALKDFPLFQSALKKNLFLAIQGLTEPLNSKYLEKYAMLFPEPEEGENFQYVFKGLGDEVFSEMILSLKEGQVLIDTKNKQPHFYFDEVYASILIQNSLGIKIYEKIYNGKVTYSAMKETIQLNEGDYITVTHKESKEPENRLQVKNKDLGVNLKVGEMNSYQISTNGLRPISQSEIPQPNPLKPTTISDITTDTTTVSGTGESNGQIELKVGMLVIGSGKVGLDGKYSLTIAKQTKGSIVKAIVSKNGLTSETQKIVTAIQELKPTTMSDINTDTTKVSGTGESSCQIDLKVGVLLIASGFVRPDGKYSLTIDKQTEGSTVKAIVSKNGLTSEAEKIVTAVQELEPTTMSDIDTDTTRISGTGAKYGRIILKVGDTGIGNGTVKSDGTYSITISKQSVGTIVKAIVYKDNLTSETQKIVMAAK
ncbi:putative mucin/carbohydrate-binding domain-containing protein [Carnobacterium maltaromaticum]|uniref:putative mucin/carbohydrate-binding domain-containing protein n=1 Tax=Carnobacterium maltaromaticum TaxID=2751 RepID=UPI0019F6FDC8|nr:putative mucin/carbohydrate-binding domain-containing protein [Carnobacterium maltaromaticum]CAD5900051.1 conserved hypothetical protein [Carnobacterium maltaromaticum]